MESGHGATVRVMESYSDGELLEIGKLRGKIR